MIKNRLLAVGLFSFFCSASLAAESPLAAGLPSTPFGRPLVCTSQGPTSVLVVAVNDFHLKPGISDARWALMAMSRVGYSAKIPPAGLAKDAALGAAALLKNGSIVSAKIAKDQADAAIHNFKSSSFSTGFEALLTVMTQPVSHASYPDSVRAAGEASEAASSSRDTHGVDLEDASGSLLEVISRAGTSQKAMGPAYEKPAVRYYLLANGFRDEIALQAARNMICAEHLDDATLKRLDVSARFMAMPARRKSTQETAK